MKGLPLTVWLILGQIFTAESHSSEGQYTSPLRSIQKLEVPFKFCPMGYLFLYEEKNEGNLE